MNTNIFRTVGLCGREAYFIISTQTPFNAIHSSMFRSLQRNLPLRSSDLNPLRIYYCFQVPYPFRQSQVPCI